MDIVVTGASGFLGWQFSALCPSVYDAVGTSYTSDCERLLTLDVRDSDAVADFLHRTDPDAVVHLAGIADPDECHRHEAMAYEVNRDGTEHVARASQRVGARLVYVSTSFVFSVAGTYDTDATPAPNTVYGRSKYQGELAVQEHHDDYAIVRCPKLFGGEVRSHSDEIIGSILAALSSQGRVELDDKTVRYPTLVDDVVAAIRRLLEGDERGTYHVSTHTPYTKYEFGKAVADAFDLEGEVVAETTETVAERPSGIELATGAIERLGVEITPVEQALQDLRCRY